MLFRLTARVGVSVQVRDHGELRSSGGRTRSCQAEFLARVGDHTDGLWTSILSEVRCREDRNLLQQLVGREAPEETTV